MQGVRSVGIMDHILSSGTGRGRIAFFDLRANDYITVQQEALPQPQTTRAPQGYGYDEDDWSDSFDEEDFYFDSDEDEYNDEPMPGPTGLALLPTAPIAPRCILVMQLFGLTAVATIGTSMILLILMTWMILITMRTVTLLRLRVMVQTQLLMVQAQLLSILAMASGAPCQGLQHSLMHMTLARQHNQTSGCRWAMGGLITILCTCESLSSCSL